MIFNIIEYFTFINLSLLFLFIIISLFFILMKSSLLYYSNVNINHSLIEFISTLFSLLFLILIISPTLIILLDFDLIILPSFIIYSLGLQWAWQFNIIFLPLSIGFESYCDHYIISSINKKSISSYSCFYIIDKKLKAFNFSINKWIAAYRTLKSDNNRTSYNQRPNDQTNNPIKADYLINNSRKAYLILINKQAGFKDVLLRRPIESLMVTRYLIDISQYMLLPIYSFIRLFLYSFDVIHTLGFYSWGIKIDAIPGRINLTTTLRLLWKGEYRGKCFELCGQGHLSMLITTLVALFIIDRPLANNWTTDLMKIQ